MILNVKFIPALSLFIWLARNKACVINLQRYWSKIRLTQWSGIFSVILNSYSGSDLDLSLRHSFASRFKTRFRRIALLTTKHIVDYTSKICINTSWKNIPWSQRIPSHPSWQAQTKSQSAVTLQTALFLQSPKPPFASQGSNTVEGRMK